LAMRLWTLDILIEASLKIPNRVELVRWVKQGQVELRRQLSPLLVIIILRDWVLGWRHCRRWHLHLQLTLGIHFVKLLGKYETISLNQIKTNFHRFH